MECKYIYSSTVPQYNFEVLVLYLSILISCHPSHSFHSILEANTLHFTFYSKKVM